MVAYAEELFDAVVAGIVSIPPGLTMGIQRTYEDLAGSESERAENAGERVRLVSAVTQAARYGMSESGPVSKMVKHIITEYYDLLPDSLLTDLAEKAAVSSGVPIARQGGGGYARSSWSS